MSDTTKARLLKELHRAMTVRFPAVEAQLIHDAALAERLLGYIECRAPSSCRRASNRIFSRAASARGTPREGGDDT